MNLKCTIFWNVLAEVASNENDARQEKATECSPAYLGITGSHLGFGYQVVALKKGSPAFDTDLSPGDVIVSINDRLITHDHTLHQTLGCLTEDNVVVLGVNSAHTKVSSMAHEMRFITLVPTFSDSAIRTQFFGAYLDTVPSNLYSTFSIPEDVPGLIVTEVV